LLTEIKRWQRRMLLQHDYFPYATCWTWAISFLPKDHIDKLLGQQIFSNLRKCLKHQSTYLWLTHIYLPHLK
jgi:hypothetical protein